ncbi:MAG TPA: DUF488 domain-containing protein [Bryobacteraceae bacterium]|jgi:uncharacterized protein (DUF488 family)|nr:DUF488 domain-containing protein [Bryobacteraceae bacterium]
MEQTVFTIGHSTHQPADFLALLMQHKITAVCDVRSKPYSRLNPQFNREALRQTLTSNGIVYVFLGKELGAQSDDLSNYEDGKVQYDRLAKTELFQQGIQRVQEGMKQYRVAIMCAEKEPLECHRTILVARQLTSLGIGIQHIHATGELESHADALDRLRRLWRLPEADLFRGYEEILADACRRQEERIAYESTSAAVAGSAG